MNEVVSNNSDDEYYDSIEYNPNQNPPSVVPTKRYENPQEENDQLHSKFQKLQQNLLNLQTKRAQVAKLLKTIHDQQDRLTTYKNQVEKNYYSKEISELHSIAMRTQSNHDWLALTQKINALNDCFYIWHRGQFGTINGLRMGGEVPPIPIPEEMKSKSHSTGIDLSQPGGVAGSVSAGGSNDYMMNFSIGLNSPSESTRTDSRDSNTVMPLHSESGKNKNNTAHSPTLSVRNQTNENVPTGNGSNTNTSTTSSHSNKNNDHIITSSVSIGPNPNPHAYNHFKVPWSEVNAALGTAALLLATLEENRNNPIKFHAHKIIPMGSFSKIVLLPQSPNTNKSPITYNLYSDDSFSLFGKRNFNIALNALLKCLKDAADIAFERDKTMAFPHEICCVDSDGSPISSSSTSASALSYLNSNRGDFFIGGLSIAYGADGERWTRALKYFLTDLKWLVAFVVKHVDR